MEAIVFGIVDVLKSITLKKEVAVHIIFFTHYHVMILHVGARFMGYHLNYIYDESFQIVPSWCLIRTGSTSVKQSFLWQYEKVAKVIVNNFPTTIKGSYCDINNFTAAIVYHCSEPLYFSFHLFCFPSQNNFVSTEERHMHIRVDDILRDVTWTLHITSYV